MIELLRRQAPFADMDDGHIEQVLWGSRVQTLAAGERLYERGRSARHFFIVVEGRSVVRTPIP